METNNVLKRIDALRISISYFNRNIKNNSENYDSDKIYNLKDKIKNAEKSISFLESLLKEDSYKILNGGTLTSLNSKINELIKLGYKPQGGILYQYDKYILGMYRDLDSVNVNMLLELSGFSNFKIGDENE